MNSVILDISTMRNVGSAYELLESVYRESIEEIELPIDLEKIVSSLAYVRFSDELTFDDWDKSGYVKVERKKGTEELDHIKLWVNSSDAQNRQRFTTGRELGHLFLDIMPNINDTKVSESHIDKYHRGNGRGSGETKADMFSAQLLMPAKLVERELMSIIDVLKNSAETRTLGSLVASMASKFEVSEQSMRIRLENLGYIN